MVPSTEMLTSWDSFSIAVKEVGCKKPGQECKEVTLRETIFTKGHGNEVNTEASMISRLKCQLGNLHLGEKNCSEYAFLLLQLGSDEGASCFSWQDVWV